MQASFKQFLSIENLILLSGKTLLARLVTLRCMNVTSNFLIHNNIINRHIIIPTKGNFTPQHEGAQSRYVESYTRKYFVKVEGCCRATFISTSSIATIYKLLYQLMDEANCQATSVVRSVSLLIKDKFSQNANTLKVVHRTYTYTF